VHLGQRHEWIVVFGTKLEGSLVMCGRVFHVIQPLVGEAQVVFHLGNVRCHFRDLEKRLDRLLVILRIGGRNTRIEIFLGLGLNVVLR
jgi:hypothetical protein